jgi:YteA family regulatory protein
LEYEKRLEQARRETASSLADLEMDLSQSLKESVGELSAYDNHPQDIADETFEREKDFALRENQRARLDDIDAALARIHDGTFGKCLVCGEEIEPGRLEALPYAARCLGCQLLQQDLSRERPIEESLEDELYRNSFTDDDPKENVGFDGEDTWQAVARYGTSNTPGDFRQASDYDDAAIDHDEPIGAVFDVENLPESFEESRAHYVQGRRKPR